MALSARCLRCLVISFSIILAVSGFAVFILNFIFLYKLVKYGSFLTADVDAPAITLLIIGIISCLLSWVGWKAAWNKHRPHIIMFGVLLIIVIIVELICSVWSLVIWEHLKDGVTTAVDEDFSLLMNRTVEDKDAVKRWEKVQADLQCCGAGGPLDYRKSRAVPWSCCVLVAAASVSVGAGNAHSVGDCSTFYQRGCVNPIIQEIQMVVLYVCLTALGAALLQGTGLLCTFYLVTALGRPSPSPPSPWQPPAEPSGSSTGETLLKSSRSAPSKY